MTDFKNVDGVVYPVAANATEAKRIFSMNYEKIHVMLGNEYKGTASNIDEFRELHG